MRQEFIADSSPIGNDGGMHARPCALREGQTRREAGTQSLEPPPSWEEAGPSNSGGATMLRPYRGEGVEASRAETF
jgi:hypothetical protein